MRWTSSLEVFGVAIPKQTWGEVVEIILQESDLFKVTGPGASFHDALGSSSRSWLTALFCLAKQICSTHPFVKPSRTTRWHQKPV